MVTRVLVVDDEALARERLRDLLGRLDGAIEVGEAADARAAYARLISEPWDVLLLDVQMPGMDGHQLCAELKADPLLQDIAVIFVTAQDQPDDETRALHAGAADFITKPFNPTVVHARVRTQLTLKAQADLLRELAFVDGLTGVHNRRHFDARLQAESRRAQRSRAPLAVALADVDHFKRYNDHYGHQAGDACLQAVARALKGEVYRAPDLLARYGGEELVALLVDTDLAGARVVAERAVAAVRALALPHADSPTAPVVTVSAGVGSMVPHAPDDGPRLLRLADAALYAAKQAGRNRAVVAPPDDPDDPRQAGPHSP